MNEKANSDYWLGYCVGRVVIEFRLVFSRWYRGGVKSQFNPIRSNPTNSDEPPMSLPRELSDVPVGVTRVPIEHGRRG